MKFVALAAAAVLSLSAAQAAESRDDSVLAENQFSTPWSDDYTGAGLRLAVSCQVTTKGLRSYDYVISIEYTSDVEQLMSWNYLDWILSQYPNALEHPGFVTGHLFPLKVGSGNYTFRFTSEYFPVVYDSHMQVFKVADPERESLNQKGAAEYSGVTINSHDYLSAHLGLGQRICLPANLRVFPESDR
jgi:hypothetical protein